MSRDGRLPGSQSRHRRHRLSPTAVIVAANAFDAVKATATNYIAYCTPNPAPAGCSDAAIQKLIPAACREMTYLAIVLAILADDRLTAAFCPGMAALGTFLLVAGCCPAERSALKERARMGDDFWKWLIGILGTCILGLVGTGKYLQSNINVNAKAIREDDDVLHERVNRVRDELARDFVRKSDIDAHLSRIDENWRDLRSEMKDAQKDTIGRLGRRPEGYP
jgi:hypothetical protein